MAFALTGRRFLAGGERFVVHEDVELHLRVGKKLILLRRRVAVAKDGDIEAGGVRAGVAKLAGNRRLCLGDAGENHRAEHERDMMRKTAG